jgi:hypothetical protein
VTWEQAEMEVQISPGSLMISGYQYNPCNIAHLPVTFDDPNTVYKPLIWK